MSCQLAPTASPRLLLFQHVEKTGGTSLREWLKTRAHDTARFGVVPYTSAACFLCRHRELALCPVPCHKDGPLLYSSIFASCSLMKSSVAVEFHASIGHALYQKLRSHLPELRRKYAAHNGTLRTLTILREPVAHMLSVFRMWPPRMPRRPPAGGEEYIEQIHRLRAAPLVPFDAWLPLASGLQCCALTAPFVARMPYGWTPSPPAEQRGCSPACHQRLAEFDLVGLTSCMPSVYRAAEAALALPTNTSLDALVTVVKAGERRSQFAEGSALLAGTRAALGEVGRRTMTLSLDGVTPAHFGALVALFERAVGLYASLVGINAYDQPGVEAGKRCAADVLALQTALLAHLEAGHEGDASALAGDLGADS